MASNGPNDFGTFRIGSPPSAGALQKMSNRLRSLTPIMSGERAPNVISIPGSGTAIGRQPPARKTIQFIRAKLTTQLADKGKYLGKRVRGLPDYGAAGDLSSDDLGVEETDETLLIYNPAEVNGGGSGIAVPSAMVYVEVGVRQPETGYLVCVLIGSLGGDIPVPIYQGQVIGASADNTLAATFPFYTDP